MEEYAAQLSEALERRGCRSVLFFSAEGDPGVRKQLEGSHAIVEIAPSLAGGHARSSVLRSIRRFRPAVVHFHFIEHFSLLPLQASLLGAASLLFTDHVRTPQRLSMLTKLKLRAWNAVLPRIARFKVLAPSEHVRGLLIEQFSMDENTVELMPNGINLRRFVPLQESRKAEVRRRLGLAAGKKLVACVAALIPEKGLTSLLQAARITLRSHPDSHFVIAGQGPLLPALQQEAGAMAIAEHVTFAGWRSDVQEILGAADVACVPSVWVEPAGLVTLEAMACACPLVAARTGGIPEHVTSETAILVEPGVPAELAHAIETLLDNRAQAEAMGRAARQWVEERYSMEGWIERTIRLYEPALGLPAARLTAAQG